MNVVDIILFGKLHLYFPKRWRYLIQLLYIFPIGIQASAYDT